ncbi:MAG: hypothetical protein IT256_01575 [Chitinophagaceae bacterium]|nr:hypothetical protein [Chitinophagaceae bacterium]
MAPICFIFAGVALQSVIDLFRGFRFIPGLVAVGFAVFFSLDSEQINTYSKEVNYRQSKIYNTNIYKQIDQLVPSNINVVINLNAMEHVDAMFYSKRIEAYHSEISEAEFEKFAQKSIPIAAFASREGHVLPDYIVRYPLLYIIKANLK